ncbi:hypothetical protein [Natrarchaeobius halalkaliphilus]|uniref:hypothetical protein n=1 Tax=Natrarchaeobius halalkaliphilus TaxID=1679091 RepID=UPI000F52BC6E|nr:hypothetical protein [Natrarchaeobius halalkaliphilus]
MSELLDAADAGGASLVGSDDDRDESVEEATSTIRDAAREADELVATTEPNELLEAVGIAVSTDDDADDTIPAAIARGDADRLEDLNRLLSLARLGGRSDEDSQEQAVDLLTSARKSESVDDGVTAGEADAGTDLEDRLRSTMSTTIDSAEDELTQLRERLESASAAAVDGRADDENRVEEDESESDTEDETDSEDEKTATEGETDDDGFGFGSAGGRSSSSGRSGRHSTVAPSPSRRADMKAVRRFSTMPETTDG